MKKETIFIYSIIRNRENSVQTFYSQVKQIVETFPEYNFLLSLYENDSTDKTKENIEALDWSFIEHKIVMENINTKYFSSTKDSERVELLANARNKAIEVNDFLDRSDYILMLEADMVFNIDAIRKIFKFKRIKPDFDVVSSISMRPEGRRLYDVWGTRRNSTEKIGNLFRGWPSKQYEKYYATSNGICMYKSQPFKDGLRYHHYNESLGTTDCEMVVICDKLQRMGHNNIYIVYNAVAIHLDDKKASPFDY